MPSAEVSVSLPPCLSPEHSGIILFLKDTGLSPDDHAVAVRLFLHVGGVAGSVEGEEERAIGHVVSLKLQLRTVHCESIERGLDPGHLERWEGNMRLISVRASFLSPSLSLLPTLSEYFTPSLMRSTSTTLDSISAFITCPLGGGIR